MFKMIVKNTILNSLLSGLCFITLWVILITIEVYYGHQKLLLPFYLISIVCFFIYLQISNQKKFSSYFSNGKAALVSFFVVLIVTILYTLLGVVFGVNYKFFIGGII